MLPSLHRLRLEGTAVKNERDIDEASVDKRSKTSLDYVLTLHCIPHKYEDYFNKEDEYLRRDIEQGSPIVGAQDSMVSIILNNVKLRRNWHLDASHQGRWDGYEGGNKQKWDATRLVDAGDLLVVLTAAAIMFRNDAQIPDDAPAFISTIEHALDPMREGQINPNLKLVKESRNSIKSGDVFYMRKDFTNKRIVFISDYHGSLHSLAETLDYMSKPPQNMFQDNKRLSDDVIVICTGDIVDRTLYSIETLFLLLSLKVENPNNVYITLGNHEVHEDQWEMTLGLFTELRKEYPEHFPRIQAAIKHVFNWLPAAMILETDVGRLQAVHGCYERIFDHVDPEHQTNWEMLYRAMFKEFVNIPDQFHHTFKAYISRLGRNSHDLAWRDITTNDVVRQDLPIMPMRDPREAAHTAEVHKYLQDHGIKMLIKGHQDMAMCSLAIYPNIDKENIPEWFSRLQNENSGDLVEKYGKYKRPIDMSGRPLPDLRGLDDVQVEENRGKFVYNATDFYRYHIYNLWMLDLSEDDAITKTLTGSNPADQTGIVAVITSSSTLSKRMPPMLLQTTFLMVDRKKED